MTTNIRNLFSINGVIDTNKSVMDNMQTLGDAAGAFVTFDTIGGLWSVIINRAKQYRPIAERTAKTITQNASVLSDISKFGTGGLQLTGASNSYIQVPVSTDFQFGTGNFCVELWIKKNLTGSYESIFDFRQSLTNTQISLELFDSELTFRTGNTVRITAANAIPSNQFWYHIALARNSGVTRLFVNGQQVGSSYTDNNNYISGRPRFGALFDQTNPFRGYFDEIRVSNTARYTSNFTAIEEPFVNDANTRLLIHFDDETLEDDVFGSELDVNYTFTKSNIIGPITISGKGLNEFYNKVEFRYANKDLNDEGDIVTVSVDTQDLYPNEVDNTLNFGIDIVNDPIQAEYLASIELKQNRLDKIIRFDTDFSALGVKAGDIILMNIDDYGDVLQNAYYRVTEVEEQDADSGEIVLSITAMEHNDSVYDSTGLVRQQRSAKTGITYADANITVVENRQVAGINQSASGLLLPLAASAGLRFLNSLFNKKNVEEAVFPLGFQITVSTGSFTTFVVKNTGLVETYSSTFTPKYNGTYIGQFFFDQNSSGAFGRANDRIGVAVEVEDQYGTRVAFETSGGEGSWYWNDYILTTQLPLLADTEYTIRFFFENNPETGSASANFNVSWNIFVATGGAT